MASFEERQEAYGPEWFRNRAFNSLKRGDDGVWDFSDSLLLYPPGKDEAYEAVQQVDTPYHALVTQPERQYLEGIADRIVAALPNDFEYIDLGPGTEHKEQFIFDAAKRAGKTFVYRPVDINKQFLKLAVTHATGQGIVASPLQSAFEELSQKLGKSEKPRFISLGLTYSNYAPQDILTLLKSLTGENGTAFVNAQLRERADMKKLTEIYTDQVKDFFAPKLGMLGLNPETDVEAIEVDDGIRAWYTLKNSNAKLEAKGIKAGDKLLVFQSLRPSRESLEQDISAVFPSYELLDSGGPFVGALLKGS